MFKFDNTHIFTGYLKQLLSSYNLPTCKVYTNEFAEYYKQYGKEDPRVIESFDNISYVYDKKTSASKQHIATRVNYLKGHEIYNYFWAYEQSKPKLNHNNTFWKRSSNVFYDSSSRIPGLTKTLNSLGNLYDSDTHEYLGEYLRFMRDYYNINLMSMYNCFNNKICNNLYYLHKIKTINSNFNIYAEESSSNSAYKESSRVFDSRDSKYHIYAIPVKLFAEYTIAIDCSQEIEMFCGFYKTALDTSSKSIDLINKTYLKVNRTFFKQPFLYDKLSVKYWNFEQDSLITKDMAYPQFVNNKVITRWDIANHEQDLKLFIKIPVSCKSSIVILEGDFRSANDFKYSPTRYNSDGSIFNKNINDPSNTKTIWEYKQNHSVINFGDKVDLNTGSFKPISKLQLLALNTGESYPFADRLVEYLSGSAITPIDTITDNIKRAQKVMSQNHHYFKIDGLWEDKMQKILYDYMVNSGPIVTVKADNGSTKLIDKRQGYHPRLGHTSKSTLYDVLGYVDKETEKWYASWTKEGNQAKVHDNIQNVDIYNGLYDM
jgi:hypothetical protein